MKTNASISISNVKRAIAEMYNIEYSLEELNNVVIVQDAVDKLRNLVDKELQAVSGVRPKKLMVFDKIELSRDSIINDLEQILFILEKTERFNITSKAIRDASEGVVGPIFALLFESYTEQAKQV